MFLIKHRSDGTFLKHDPVWGRFLRWAAEEQSAQGYKTRLLAEEAARFIWLADWTGQVEIVEVKRYRVKCWKCSKEIPVGPVEKEAADRGAMFFCSYECFCDS